jgi:hypothetical protein
MRDINDYVRRSFRSNIRGRAMYVCVCVYVGWHGGSLFELGIKMTLRFKKEKGMFRSRARRRMRKRK